MVGPTALHGVPNYRRGEFCLAGEPFFWIGGRNPAWISGGVPVLCQSEEQKQFSDF